MRSGALCTPAPPRCSGTSSRGGWGSELLASQAVVGATVVGATTFYLLVTLGLALTDRPSADEGLIANAAFNLVTNGVMGTPVQEPAGHYIFATGSRPEVTLSGIKERTYWVMPLHILAQAGWYKLFGFSILSLRSLSIFWSLIALLSWFFIITALLGDRRLALLACLFTGFDYAFINIAVLGRMDMMCAALGFAAIAFYLQLRERNLMFAVLGSQTFVAASGLTHPNGLMAFVSVLLLAFWLDHSRLTWRHLLAAGIPYLVGAASWGLYILQSPSDFLAQFSANAGLGRFRGLTSPWAVLKEEITLRYLPMYGFGPHSTSLARLKSTVIVVYLCALVCALYFFVRGRLRHKGYGVFFGVTAIYLALQTFFNLKFSFYLVHTMPFLATAFVICIWSCRSRRNVPNWLPVTIALGLLAFQVTWAAHGIARNEYRAWYTPVVEDLKGRSDAGLIIGSAELGLDLQFPDNLVNDVTLGYSRGRVADVIVISVDYESAFKVLQMRRPDLYRYITRLLNQEYDEVYSNPYYRIYVRRA